jgi:cytochrome c biogenesis protein CcmG, thiol:disulfide interchange protein DsbE
MIMTKARIRAPLAPLAPLAAVLAVLAAAACSPPAPDSVRALQPGDTAPAYAALDLAGDTVDIADFRGHVVLLNIWATWCIPCREEMPLLNTAYQRYSGSGLRVVGVSIDASGGARDILDFMVQHDITFPILHDPAESVMRVFRARAVPTTFLIDRSGIIRRLWVGPFDPFAQEAHSPILRALEEL